MALFTTVLILGLGRLPAAADGTENLGVPSLALGEGTGTVVAGTGLLNAAGTGNIDFTVPGAVVQALLYWQRHSNDVNDLGPTDTLTVGGNPVEGDIIGGDTLFFNDIRFATYRADVTGLVASGVNSLSVQGVVNPSDVGDGHDGAGVLVIFDDGSAIADIQVRDGLDLAFCGFAGDLNVTVPQAFSFAAAADAREATVSTFYGSIADSRGSEVRILVDGVEAASAIDQLGNIDGPEWDTLKQTFTVPAGATSVEIQVLSRGDSPFCASLAWVGAGLTIAGIPPRCPNGTVDPEEECDDGNLIDDDACSNDCKANIPLASCRMTGGGNERNAQGTNSYTYGGQAGAPTAEQPQPYGEWTHHQRRGPDGRFTFHAGTASAPPQTRIANIVCSDPGYCSPARPAPAKQLDFNGVGTFSTIRNPSASLAGVVAKNTFHWFEVHVEDLGEPGSEQGEANTADCPAEGNAGSIGMCKCLDYYHIKIYKEFDPNTSIPNTVDVIYEQRDYADGGNFQIHPPVGTSLRP